MVRMDRESFRQGRCDAAGRSPCRSSTATATLPATLVGVSGNVLRAQFDPLTILSRKKLSRWCFTPAPTPGSAGARLARQTNPRSASPVSSDFLLHGLDQTPESLEAEESAQGETRHQYRSGRFTPRTLIWSTHTVGADSGGGKRPERPPPGHLRQSPHPRRSRRKHTPSFCMESMPPTPFASRSHALNSSEPRRCNSATTFPPASCRRSVISR